MYDFIFQEVEEKTALIKKREAGMRNMSADLLKANEIIKKFQARLYKLLLVISFACRPKLTNAIFSIHQDQVRSEHQKVKLSAQVLNEQDKLITDKEAELESARSELKASSEATADAGAKLEEAAAGAERLREELREAEKRVRTGETVIHWLNKQLTAAQARDPGLRIGPPPEGLATTVFSTSGIAAASTPFVAARKGAASLAMGKEKEK